MGKKTQGTAYRCSECGWQTAKWVGRCAECGQWGTVAEPAAATVGRGEVLPITEVPAQGTVGRPTGIGELDRVLGGGLVAGAVVLLAGEPGVGKSTLLLEVARRWAGRHGRTLYVTGEESTTQVRLRAERTGAVTDGLLVAAETDLGTILDDIDAVDPGLVVVDSIQTVQVAGGDGVPGGVSQIKEATTGLIRVAKARGLPIVIVGQVTKDGSVAGPRFLEHLVDVVLSFEGDRHTGIRLVRATKNRFGPAEEVGCFELSELGIVEVTDPSGLFAGQRRDPVPGTCLTVTLEGQRPLLAEVQALAAPSASTPPRRMTHGLDAARVAMVLAVAERKGRVRLPNHDVYVSTVGGARIGDPCSDLAVAVAIASAAREQAVPDGLVVFGEVGLSGELRPVRALPRRLAEAGRLGFTRALVPSSLGGEPPCDVPDSMRVVDVATVSDALTILGLSRRLAAVEHAADGTTLPAGRATTAT
ncbi:DNA repair protein RadA [Propionicicella superfundia]|uniref:DNA repair protein RadA n=1 Tax=Propionicicella superfundia TaxID=348582 RepID=UPI0004172EBF|nr:DNA repair protein RadA [Propionicicella superfundia]